MPTAASDNLQRAQAHYGPFDTALPACFKVSFSECSIALYAGPFCGGKDVPRNIAMQTSQMTIIFYSDTRGTLREGGVFRALAQVQGKSDLFSYQTSKCK